MTVATKRPHIAQILKKAIDALPADTMLTYIDYRDELSNGIGVPNN